jgi:hypothetical protein
VSNHVSHGSLPYPIKNARYTLLVGYLDADGDPTDPTTPDTEVSQDGGAFADAAEEMTTVSGSNGMGYVTLTGAETNNSLVAVACKVASGPKATLASLYPRNLPILATGTLAAGSAGGGTLGTVLAYDVTGCFLRTTGGTGGGGTGGANNQARRIITYNLSTGAFTVSPNWETTPSTDTTYDLLCPEGISPGLLKALNPTTAGRTLDVSAGGEAGLDWANIGSPTTTVGLSGTTVKTATDVETDTQDIQARLPAALGANGNLKADVRDFSGTAGTFASGRPEVNTSHWKGTAAATVDAAGYPVVTVKDGTGQGEIATTSGAVDTVTALTNAPSDSSGVTTLLSRLSALRAGYLDNLSAGAVALAATFTGITSLAQWLGLLGGKQTGNTTARTELRATGAASGTFDETTDSLEAVRDRGDAAYTTVAASAIRSAVGLASANLDTQLSAVQADTDDIQARLPAALVSGRMDASVGAMASGVLTATAIAADAITAAKVADGTIDAATFAAGAINAAAIAADAITDAKVASDVTIASVTGAVGSVTGAVGSVTGAVGSVTGAVGSIATGGIAAASFAAGAIDAAAIAANAIGASELAADAAAEIASAVRTELTTELARVDVAVSTRLATSGYTVPPTVGAIADQVWEETLADHSGTAGSTAAALNAAGSAGDPWSTAVPGAYGSGTAGKILGDNLNATVSSRATQASVDDIPTNSELATALGTADDAVLAAIAALNNLSQANIRTAVGLGSANLDTQLDALPTNAELATALGTADDAVLAAIAALNNLSQANVRTALGMGSANLDTQLDALPTNAELATALASADDAVLAAISALNNLSAAQVKTQVVSALATDTYAEPTAPPAATATLAAKIAWLTILARNVVTQTATQQKVKADDGTTTVGTAAVSDDGSQFTRGEFA